MSNELKGVVTGLRKRTLVTATLAGKVGLAMAKRTLRGRPADDAAPAPDDTRDAARALVRELGALKGLVMKVGQIRDHPLRESESAKVGDAARVAPPQPPPVGDERGPGKARCHRALARPLQGCRVRTVRMLTFEATFPRTCP